MIARRRAVPDDAPAIAAVIAEGFATFTAFAPPGWAPAERATPENVEAIRGRLWLPGAWVEVADAAGEVVGVASFEPQRGVAPDVAYLIHCFVRCARRVHDSLQRGAASDSWQRRTWPRAPSRCPIAAPRWPARASCSGRSPGSSSGS